MGAITKEMVHAAYAVGKQVKAGDIRQAEAKKAIHLQSGMDTGSANDYVNVLISMLNGLEYHRTINTYATKYFLEHICMDYGKETYLRARIAVKAHTEYYETLGHGRLESIKKLIETLSCK
ncbi:MAG TPA: hypothetical protein VIL27_08090 [Clostridia bacterium]